MNLIQRLLGARPATISPEMRVCIALAQQEAASRGALQLSVSYCALALLRRSSDTQIAIPLPDRAPSSAEHLVRTNLIHELEHRLPAIRTEASQSPLCLTHDLARLVMHTGDIEETRTLLNTFLSQPDATLAEAISAAKNAQP